MRRDRSCAYLSAGLCADLGVGQIERMDERDREKRERSSGRLIVAAFATVLIAQGFRIAGVLRDDGLALIYVSIGLSAAAAVMLFIGVRIRRRG